MASFAILPLLNGSLLRSQFLGQDHLLHYPRKHTSPFHRKESTQSVRPCAKFNLQEILGGRGLCNGEQGLQQELKREVDPQPPPAVSKEQEKSLSTSIPEDGFEKEMMGLTGGFPSIPDDGFEKEMMGLTGGFPGGERGLQKFIEENPPPKPAAPAAASGKITDLSLSKKPKPPELPLLLPGMIAIVKNPNNPFYMYCGIVQRITDGKAGVLFEGGNWDRLITFRLEELERREKGPPMKNPKSVVLEQFLQKKN